MSCPNCGLQITDPRLPNCPRCGQPLYASAPAPDQQPQGQGGMSPYPGYGAQPTMPPPSYGAPPTTPSTHGDQAQTPYPGASYGQPPTSPPAYGGDPYAGQQPAGAQPGYPTYGQPSYGQPPYGQPAAPSTPMYGQPAAPSTPMYGQYGQPAAPSTPYYGQGMPGGYPPPQPPQRKRNLGLIIGLPVAIVLVLCIGGFAALAVIGSRVSTSTSTNTGTSATSTPTEQVLFQDALTSSSHNDSWPNDGNCAFASDGYHVKGAYLCYAPTNDVSDGTISVQAAQASGDTTQDYGLVFRRASKGNYYVFGIESSGKWDFYKGVNNTASNIVEPTVNSAIKTGLNAKNTLKVTMSGSHFTFFVNDVQVGTADDSTFTSGKSGVAGGDSIESVYTDYKVTK